MSEKPVKFIHFTLDVTINENDWGYSSPKAEDRFNFTMPMAMFNVTNLKNLISDMVENLEKKYPLEKEAYEQEQERARLEEEANAVVGE